jgi:heme oxygenase
MCRSDGIRRRLQVATAQTHQRLEQRLDIIAALADSDRRAGLMKRFWGLHKGAEVALTPLLGPLPGLDYAARSKVALLSADIVAITGIAPGDNEPICAFKVQSLSAGLGLAYVLEGSTLGGSIIYREMLARGASASGLRFFNPYGRQTGLRWREFLAVLDRAASDEAAAALIIEGATEGFERVEGWLCGATPSQS